MLQIIELVDFAFSLYIFLLFVRIIMSWIPIPDNPSLNIITGFIHDVTEPFLGLFRRLLPVGRVGGMGIDFSPIIAFIVLGVVKDLVNTILTQTLI